MSEKIVMERTYRATLEEMWALWTTKDGIESWWGPEGFSVTVHHLDLRVGGTLTYTMTATGPEQVAFMQGAGMPLATRSTITYTEVAPGQRLGYEMTADFIPGVRPYPVATTVSFDAEPEGVRMTLAFDAMHDEEWTQRSVMGHEGELGRLERVLSATPPGS
jgi:uncharacterized protein YndB with AHSA1/START domain